MIAVQIYSFCFVMIGRIEQPFPTAKYPAQHLLTVLHFVTGSIKDTTYSKGAEEYNSSALSLTLTNSRTFVIAMISLKSYIGTIFYIVLRGTQLYYARHIII